MKGSVASTSRNKRNARKRSFDKSMSATSVKMARVTDDTEELNTTTVSFLLYTYTCRQFRLLEIELLL